jgi:hypothetical protein
MLGDRQGCLDNRNGVDGTDHENHAVGQSGVDRAALAIARGIAYWGKVSARPSGRPRFPPPYFNYDVGWALGGLPLRCRI